MSDHVKSNDASARLACYALSRARVDSTIHLPLPHLHVRILHLTHKQYLQETMVSGISFL